MIFSNLYIYKENSATKHPKIAFVAEIILVEKSANGSPYHQIREAVNILIDF